MEEAKSTESTGSSSGEITAESGTAKSEKTHRKKNIADVRETRHTRSKTMVETLHPIHKDDTKHRNKFHYERPRKPAEAQKRAGTQDLFFWALCESAITEMTRTVRENGVNKMELWLHFIQERNNLFS